MALENYILPENADSPHISLHLFRALLQEYIEGAITGPQFIDFVEAQLGEELAAGVVNDLIAIAALINAEATTPDKMGVADRVYRIFVIAESKNCTLYDSRAKIKARLGLI